MPVTISAPDGLRQSVEAATGGRNTVLYDELGHPSVMVIIPAFRLQDIDPGLGNGLHPAFVVNGTPKGEILVGKHLARVHEGRAQSQPAVEPLGWSSFDAARAACTSKGPGWHLLTNAEWSAIALWCWRNGHQPRGNTGYGQAHESRFETARRVDGAEPGTGASDGRTTTGSGPASWNHDNTVAGISDLVGNMTEWVAGLRLVDGEIQVIRDNNAADSQADHSAGSALWRGIAQDGSLVAPGTAGTLKYDSLNPGNVGTVGPVQLDDVIDNSNGGNGEGGACKSAFQSLAADAGVVIPPAARALGLAPHVGAGLGDDALTVRNYGGERSALRGGGYFQGADAGLFHLDLSRGRSQPAPYVGFRVAYVG